MISRKSPTLSAGSFLNDSDVAVRAAAVEVGVTRVYSVQGVSFHNALGEGIVYGLPGNSEQGKGSKEGEMSF